MASKPQLKKDMLTACLTFLIVIVSLSQLSAPQAPPIENALIFVSDFDPVDASRRSNSVYRIGLDGKDLRRIAGSIRHPNLDFIQITGIACHSQMQIVAMASGRQDLDGFYLASLDGSDLRQVSNGDATLTGVREIDLAPDGNQALMSREFGGSSEARLGLVRGDIQRSEFHTIKAPTNARSYRAPVWAPDGMRIAYVIESQAPDAPGRYAIAVANADGGREQVIHETNLVIEDIDWSPDGEWIAASISRQVYRMRSDGSAFQQLTRHHNGAASARWSPNGRQISFAAASTYPGQNQLMVMDADGTDVRRVTAARGNVLNGCWV